MGQALHHLKLMTRPQCAHNPGSKPGNPVKQGAVGVMNCLKTWPKALTWMSQAETRPVAMVQDQALLRQALRGRGLGGTCHAEKGMSLTAGDLELTGQSRRRQNHAKMETSRALLPQEQEGAGPS